MQENINLERVKNTFEKPIIEKEADLIFSLKRDIEKSREKIRNTIEKIVQIRSEMGVYEPMSEIPPSVAIEYKKISLLEEKLKSLNIENDLEKKSLPTPPDNLPI